MRLTLLLVACAAVAGWGMYVCERVRAVGRSREQSESAPPYMELERAIRSAWGDDPLGREVYLDVDARIRMYELARAWMLHDSRREFRVHGWRFWLEIVSEASASDPRVMAVVSISGGGKTVMTAMFGEVCP